MSERQPTVAKIEADVEPRAAAADATVPIGEVKVAGTVTSVIYTPRANLAGANTETRSVVLINKGSDGNGAVEVARKDYVSGVNALDFDENALTLSVVAGALVVAAGDMLAFQSVHAGATGLADPGGHVEVLIGAGAS